ncbi:MAG: RNB domain-containing ribonuclease [Paludibacteraceae bacterium]|nr:RNB domain-containing ribonuclease [Paludibacteraceae bacterium]
MFGLNEIQKEIVRRRDMRDVFTFTIDPADAKDFDDALSFAVVEDEEQSSNDIKQPQTISNPIYQIGVHIADVSFYVRPGTKIDDEAYQRGTSVYLVDRVLPMLPEELCNDKCSLRPNEDKLCMSVIFTMNADAQVLKYKICRTVIRSNARLNYDQAQDIICANQTGETLSRENRGESISWVSAEQEEAIKVLHTLATKLRAERIANGALTIEQDEMRFRLEEHGNPTEIYFERPNEAHHLIEEFMLLANKTVAKAVGSGRPFVYRVHDVPDSEKLEEVKKFKRQCAMTAKMRHHEVSEDAVRRAIDMLTIRAQAKAVYSTYNIGHYGLAFSHYTHFTSPIRRYPDLMVHRLVEKYILTGKKETMTREELEEKCEHCSAREQEATQAERDSIKLYQAMWMKDHIDEVLEGFITGITDFGFFVQLEESRCEGLVHMMTIEHPEDYVLGDKVTVKVVRVDINRAQIDFELA